jgi:acyl carrier protein
MSEQNNTPKVGQPMYDYLLAEIKETYNHDEKFDYTDHDAFDKLLFKEDIGMNSLDLLEFMQNFEEHFGLQITDEQIESIKNVKDYINLCLSLTQE